MTPGMAAKGSFSMTAVDETVAAGLAAYYEYIAQHLHNWAEPLSNEQFWRNPYPYGNSVGHLVLHLTGNLNYYIGARVAENGYVRDRDREFTDKQPPPKQEALAAFDRTISMVLATLRNQKAEDWGKAYTAQLEPEAADRFQIFLRCAGHAYHHVGQIVYLSRELART
ncbi:MAG TPA: DinB family protein [Candidatus Acidoferrum sp.]|nr:DinB family protein [Candidatus Acidoferrum sp.]